jgi:paired amphipathic helix protein Sin3a
VVAGPSSPRRAAHHSVPQVPRPPVNDETHFFDRVKRVLDNRDLYNEFLKLVNLFAQDYIDTARLVKESRNFLGNTELYKQFRDILGWDDKKEREHLLAEQHTQSCWTKPAVAGLPERPGRIDFSEKYGSYRKVSARVSDIYAIVFTFFTETL